ncbi:MULTISPECIES: 2-hydroxyacid dehydrogenase [unclassified Saccharopolyspora]|uniref:2-hydroxyacid dehydrogenase n=1 Tax=unclassified Saccharopolyspora TaxID=2646250 RepID=UPI001CD5C64C|nr:MULTISPECIES: 2-hydroxyacid dehydrogenase [unclassified Saccharopolyspora]MCA1188825.1 2-hydroxyacid dehydrogenase [Saccharopolyspora sp. 6T]MCA1281865.1 2-hydroxyacid dehydrogenase [Saccharopolyspora sp. 7B]
MTTPGLNVVIADTNLLPLRAEIDAGLPAGTTARWPDRQDDAALRAAIADADVYVSGDLPAELAAHGTRLKLVHAAGAGTDGIATGALPAGTVVANTFHHEKSIAEHVVAATTVVRRQLRVQDAALREGRWATPVYDQRAPWLDSLTGATVGFVGFGHIGQLTWRRFQAFEAAGVAVTRRGDVDAAAGGLEWAATIDRLDALLEAADVVVLSVPLTAETTGLIGAAELARMREHAVLVNVGRGPVVEERALYEALRDGVIGGAAIDVWYDYPAPGEVKHPSALPFHELGNVLMTPHSSGLTRQTFAGRARDVVANIGRLAAGEPLRNVVITV